MVHVVLRIFMKGLRMPEMDDFSKISEQPWTTPSPLFRENLLRFLGKSNHLGFVKPLFLSNPNTRHEHAELIISAKCIALTIL